MQHTTLIETIQSYLDSKLSVPVRTSGGTEDERPVPVVILDDVDFTDVTFHNTHLVQVVENDAAGVPDDRYFRFHYWVRLDYTIREGKDLSALQLRDALRSAFLPLVENPAAIHEDVRRVKLRGGGGFMHDFIEDRETEMTFPVRIRSFEQISNADSSALESSTLDEIQDSFDVTN